MTQLELLHEFSMLANEINQTYFLDYKLTLTIGSTNIKNCTIRHM